MHPSTEKEDNEEIRAFTSIDWLQHALIGLCWRSLRTFALQRTVQTVTHICLGLGAV